METNDVVREVENEFNCSKKIWKKFSGQQREVYNNIRRIKQDIIYPKGTIPNDVFEVVSHNYACLAAWEIKN